MSRAPAPLTRVRLAAVLLVVMVELLSAGLTACSSSQVPPAKSLASVTPTPPASLATNDGTVPVPTRGAYFGAYTTPRPDRRASISALERLVGRRFDIEHAYYRWDDTFPTADDAWTAQQGRIPFLAWSSKLHQTGRSVRWADIAGGRYDATIDARADALRRFGQPLLLTFQHEPGSLVGTGPDKGGSAADYVAAWRHIVTRFRQRGVTNVSFVWTVTAFALRNGLNSPAASSLYPGDDVIDWIAADGYNQFGCAAFGHAPWRSFQEIFRGFYAWATPHHKPLMVAEYGVQEDPSRPGRKGDWFRQVAQELPSMPEIKAVVYYNASPACPNLVTSSASALDGFRVLARDPYLNIDHHSG